METAGRSVRTGAQHGAAVLHFANAASRSERDVQLLGHAANCFEKRGAPLDRRADVQEHKFVRAFSIVASAELRRVAHVAQALELNPLYDAARIHVETGNDSASERHCADSRKFPSTRAPVSPDFSG
jgi:hypothetical protein